jgi:hypothetical protein
MYRVLGRYRKRPEKGVLPRLQGHQFNRGQSDKVCVNALRAFQGSSHDNSPTLFAEYYRLQIDSDPFRR